MRQVPGVISAAFTSQLPLSGDFETYGVQFESDPNDTCEQDFAMPSSPGYFETMRIPLRRGRLLDEHDRAGAPVAVLVSESFAKRKFSGKDPIGQRVRVGPDIGHADQPWDDDCRRGRRCEADIAGAERCRSVLHHYDAVGMG